jgi:CRISPR/Cas system CSM-associated protein Csm2 small subunit
MLQVIIDPSMLSAKPNNSDCELTINIAGCAWPVDPGQVLPVFGESKEMTDFFYPWNWARPKEVNIHWLKRDPLSPAGFKDLLQTSLAIVDNDFPEHQEDVKAIANHYDTVLNNKIIRESVGAVLVLNENEIRYDLLADQRVVIEIKGPDGTPSPSQSGFLTMTIANFAQKLSPNNLIKGLTFFAKGNVLAPADATHFVVYPVGKSENDRWSSEFFPNQTNDGLDITYTNGGEGKLIVRCPITPIPQKSKTDTPIQLRDENGNFLGHTHLKVDDLQNQMIELSNKLSSFFNLPKILYEFTVSKKESFVKADTTDLTDYLRWIDSFNIYFLSSIKDGIANKSIFLATLLNEQLRLNPNQALKNIFVKINDWKDEITVDDWKQILNEQQKFKIQLDKLTQLTAGFNGEKPEIFVAGWIQILEDILSLTNTLEIQRDIIISQSKHWLEDQELRKALAQFIENYGDVRHAQFNGLFSLARPFLFRKKLDLGLEIERREFIRRFKFSLVVYMKYRLSKYKTPELFPVVIIDPFSIAPADQSGVNWAVLYDFIKNHYKDEIDSGIRQVIEKPTDIPPQVMIKVDSFDIIPSHEDVAEDLSDEIAGHLILLQRASVQNAPVKSDEVSWKSLNWSRINLNNVRDTTITPLINDYLIPSFLPQVDKVKNLYLSLSNERLSFIAGHDTFNDSQEGLSEESSLFTFSYLFENIVSGESRSIPPAYALWYGFHYNFAGFVMLNSGVLPKSIRKDINDWTSPAIGNNQITHATGYQHYRRVPIAKAYVKALREDGSELADLPTGLLPLACELPEWHSNPSIGDDRELKQGQTLPVYLLHNNGGKGQIQDKLKIEIGKPLTSFWNWYAWSGSKIAKQDLDKVLEQELLVRADSKLQNLYLHDPALSNTIVVVVEQIFPFETTGKFQTVQLAEEDDGTNIRLIPNNFLNIELIPSEDATEVEFNIPGELKIPEGHIVKVSIHCQTKKEYFNKGTNKFHSWMDKIIDSQSPLSVEFKDHYLTHPVEFIIEAAYCPLKEGNISKPNIELNFWRQLEPSLTSGNQVIVDIIKNDTIYGYYSRTKISHQVWHWNGRLASDLLDENNSNRGDIADFIDHINPNDGKTNFAMKWEAWEFSDRPEFSALETLANLRGTRANERKVHERQTVFTDNRPVDHKALYYRFSAEIFGRYELLGGVYEGSLKAAISVDSVLNPWKRFLKKCTKPANSELPKPVIRFAIPLTASIDECAKLDEISCSSVMIVINDRWFSELGLAEKFEIGVELLPHQTKSGDVEYYLNAGLEPILSGKSLSAIDLVNNREIVIEHPDETLSEGKRENPVAVFTPEGPAGLTFDFATATPKLIGSTFILKANNIDKLMGAWSMVQIAVRRSINKHFWTGLKKDALKSEWTAKQWVQFLPDTTAMIPREWKKIHSDYGFIPFEVIGKDLKAKQDFTMPVLKTDVVKGEDGEDVFETKTERYLVLSERIQNAGGQPTETYRATFRLNDDKLFKFNDAFDSNIDLQKIKEGFGRLIIVRVTQKAGPENMSLWKMLFGENIDNTIGFEEVQKDPTAALPLITKRFSINIKQ